MKLLHTNKYQNCQFNYFVFWSLWVADFRSSRCNL